MRGIIILSVIIRKRWRVLRTGARSKCISKTCFNYQPEEGWLVGGPGADPGHTGETISLSWPGNASGSSGKSWMK